MLKHPAIPAQEHPEMQITISKKLLVTAVILLMLTLSACAVLQGTEADASGDLVASGFLEAEEVSVMTEVGGRVVELSIDEGDEVSAGDILVRLDESLLQAQRAQAQAQLDVVMAQRSLVEAREDLPQSTILDEDLDVVDAQISLAESSITLVDTQLAKLRITAPIDGTVLTRAIHIGEIAAPGVPLITIANLGTLELVVYIPEADLGRVELGASAVVSVDSYLNETFEGEVVSIAREAEFTPRNVQTKEDRVNLVFAVTIRINNADGKLKAGMPADAVIEE
jgi:HlyD family secretion protein